MGEEAMEFLEKKQKFASKEDNQSLVFLPQELVAEILLRLQIKPLFRYKCISKEWKSIISDQKFAHRYMQRVINSSTKSSFPWRHWGVLPQFTKQQYNDSKDSHPKSSVSTIHDKIIADAPPSLYVEDNDHFDYVIASSNGLILHLHPPTQENSVLNLYVSNPLTKQSVELPFFCNDQIRFGFATRVGGENATTYVTYKVVFIREVINPHIPIVNISIFSSDTGKWSDVKEVKIISPKIVFDSKPISCDSILHWFDWKKRSIVTYDPYNSPDRFGQIQLPNNMIHLEFDDVEDWDYTDYSIIMGYSGMNLVHLGHEEFLKFGDVEDCDDTYRRLRVSRLVLDYDNDKVTEQEVFVYSSKVTADFRTYVYMNSFAPVALCPWSSPFYGQATRNLSSKVRFTKISPIWFPSPNKY